METLFRVVPKVSSPGGPREMLCAETLGVDVERLSHCGEAVE